GFYNIALSANIPIVPFSLDYNKKTVLIGKPFHPTGDYQKDLIFFREFYKDAVAKNPENWCADFE
ncbi:MAG: acyltransferase, partial [Bacteroidota bacterium]